MQTKTQKHQPQVSDETYMQEPGENLSSGLVAAAADAEQGVEDDGQPAGCGHKLRSGLQHSDKSVKNILTVHSHTCNP